MNKKAKQYTHFVLAMIVGIIVALPIFLCFSYSFMKNTEFSLFPPHIFPDSFLNTANIRNILTNSRVPRYMGNSLYIALIVTIIRLIIASLAAYAFAFMKFKGKNFLFFYILGTMMIPGEALLIANYITINKLGLINTYLGVMAVFFVSASNMFMLRQNFMVMSTSLREASFLDGCGDIRFFTSICIPLSLPILSSLGISSFIAVWNAYLWPLLVMNDPQKRTVQVGIKLLMSEESNDMGVIFAGVCISLLPTTILYVFTQRTIVHGIASGAVKG